MTGALDMSRLVRTPPPGLGQELRWGVVSATPAIGSSAIPTYSVTIAGGDISGVMALRSALPLAVGDQVLLSRNGPDTLIVDAVAAAPTRLSTFTPTFTNFTLGNGTYTAYYLPMNGLMYVSVMVQCGTTSAGNGSLITVGCAIPNYTLPQSASISQFVPMRNYTGSVVHVGEAQLNADNTVAMYLEGSGAGGFTLAASGLTGVEFGFSGLFRYK